jgi:DNA-directed RNA polymerase subunit L
MNPLIESIVDEDSVLRFTVSNIDVSIINSIRRIILSEIPCFVFRTFPYNKNKAVIEINNTRFNNEIIKQRLACIPIHINDRSFNYEDHQLEIEVNNNSKEILYITTEDFKVKNKTNNSYLSESAVKSIFPPNSITNEYIDFLRLQPQLAETIPGEQIKLSCDFDIGMAKENGAYNVVSTCSFGGTIDPELIEEKWLEKQKTLTEEDREELEFIKKDWLLIEGARLVKKNSFDFIIKTLGIYDNFQLLTLACDIMIEKFTQLIGDLQSKNLINPSHNTLKNSYDIKLENESFTLGKTLEYILYTKYFGKDVKFVGFRQPHPHIPECLLKIGFNQDVDNEFITLKLVDSCTEAIEIYKKLRENFIQT